MKKITLIPANKKIEKEKLKVCAYCRVSTEEETQLNSFKNQKEYYEKYINSNKDWKLVGIYSDFGISGTSKEKRASFNKMIEDCEKGEINMIITKSVSRFARNTLDSIKVIRKLKELNVNVYFEKEKINTMSEESELMLTILSSIAEEEAISISNNVKWAVRKKFEKGEKKASKAPYGYDKDENGNLIINEVEANVVKIIFKEFIKCKNQLEIQEKIKDLDNSKILKVGSIKNIIENPIYCGEIVYQKYYNDKFKQKRNNGELPKYYFKDKNKEIISVEIFEKAQNLIRLREKIVNRKNNKTYSEFTSKVICSSCNKNRQKSIRTYNTKNKITYWRCINCNSETIRDDVIKYMFVKMINKLIKNGNELIEPYLESLENYKVIDNREEKRKQLEKEILNLEEQKYNLAKLKQKGFIETDIFISRNNEITNKIDKINDEIKYIKKTNKAFKNEILESKKLLNIVNKLESYVKDFNVDIFNEIVENITVYNARNVTFNLKNKLELDENIKEEELKEIKLKM